jgi:uncharacterized protein
VVGKVALFWALYIGVGLAVGLTKGMFPRGLQDLYVGVVASLLLMAGTWAFTGWSRSGLEKMGIEFERGSVVRLAVGLVVGGAIYAASALAISLVAGELSIVVAPAAVSAGVVLSVVASFLALSAMEELGFRGYPLRALTGAVGTTPALLLTAVAFGLSHLLYGWSWSAVLLGVIPSGLLFGVAAVVGRGLAFPIGVHAALNLAAWSIGMKETPGPWTVALAPGTEARVGQAGPWLGLGVTLIAALILFRARDHRILKRSLSLPV